MAEPGVKLSTSVKAEILPTMIITQPLKSLLLQILLHVLARDESVHSNFKQYNLDDKLVDVIISDAARQVLRPFPLFDAVITDRK